MMKALPRTVLSAVRVAALFSVLALATEARAQVTVGLSTPGASVTAATVNPGATILVGLNISGTVAILSFDLTVPTDVVASYRVEGAGALRAGRQIGFSPISATATTDTVRVVVYGTDLQSLSTRDGYSGTPAAIAYKDALASIILSIKGTATAGDKTIGISNIDAVSAAATVVTATTLPASVTIKIDDLRAAADIDRDGQTKSGDVARLVAAVLGAPITTDDATRSDLNADGKADVEDIQLAVNAFLGKPVIYQVLPEIASVGGQIVIHGANIPQTATVVFNAGATEVNAVIVAEKKNGSNQTVGLTVTIPAGAVTANMEIRVTIGSTTLRSNRRRIGVQ